MLNSSSRWQRSSPEGNFTFHTSSSSSLSSRLCVCEAAPTCCTYGGTSSTFSNDDSFGDSMENMARNPLDTEPRSIVSAIDAQRAAGELLCTCAGVLLSPLLPVWPACFWPRRNFRWVSYETRSETSRGGKFCPAGEPSLWESTAAGPGHREDSPEHTPALIRGRVDL